MRRARSGRSRRKSCQAGGFRPMRCSAGRRLSSSAGSTSFGRGVFKGQDPVHACSSPHDDRVVMRQRKKDERLAAPQARRPAAAQSGQGAGAGRGRNCGRTVSGPAQQQAASSARSIVFMAACGEWLTKTRNVPAADGADVHAAVQAVDHRLRRAQPFGDARLAHGPVCSRGKIRFMRALRRTTTGSSCGSGRRMSGLPPRRREGLRQRSQDKVRERGGDGTAGAQCPDRLSSRPRRARDRSSSWRPAVSG